VRNWFQAFAYKFIMCRYSEVACGEFVTISMHGTGTSLGDPIEVGAISAVHCNNRGAARSQPLVLEAVKSYVGHTELTAGVMGLMQPLAGLVRWGCVQVESSSDP
jgi:hypothetical protein